MGSSLAFLTSRRKALIGTFVLLFVIYELNRIYFDASLQNIRDHLPSSLYHPSTESKSPSTQGGAEFIQNEESSVHLESPHTAEDELIEWGAGNSTLGFSRIVTISAKADGRRTEDLRRAAQRTGLDIDVQVAPDWSDEEVAELEKNKQDHVFPLNRGGARAWLSHAHAVRQFIASGDTSALIIEGDVDWDIEVKKQMILISENIRQRYQDEHLRQELRKSTIQSPQDGRKPQGIDMPYALDEYDVLWVGLLGASFYASYSAPHADVLRSFSDDTIPEPSLLQPQSWPLPPQTQAPKTRTIFFPESNPAPCSTFAYAITQKSAPKLLEILTDPTVTDNAHDVTMREACKDRKLDCVSVWPEIMHHQKLLGIPGQGSAIIMADEAGQKAQEEKAKEEEAKKLEEQQQSEAENLAPYEPPLSGAIDGPTEEHGSEGGQATSNDLSKRDDPEPVKVTSNIRWSARCNSEPGWEERLRNGEPLISCLPRYNDQGQPIGVHD